MPISTVSCDDVSSADVAKTPIVLVDTIHNVSTNASNLFFIVLTSVS